MRVHDAGVIVFLMILCSAAWQDLHTRSIGCRFLVISGYLGSIYSILAKRNMQDIVVSCGIGMVLLGICKLTRGGIGEGDGWFFVISGLFLDIGENLSLFFCGLLFCFLFSLPIMVMNVWKKREIGKHGLPFLLFLLPGGIWMIAEHLNLKGMIGR